MPRFESDSPFEVRKDSGSLPDSEGFLEADPAVPGSFTDWLSQPTLSITDDPTAAQGVFWALMNQCATQADGTKSAKIIRR
jgi:hypothetical protein